MPTSPSANSINELFREIYGDILRQVLGDTSTLTRSIAEIVSECKEKETLSPFQQWEKTLLTNKE